MLLGAGTRRIMHDRLQAESGMGVHSSTRCGVMCAQYMSECVKALKTLMMFVPGGYSPCFFSAHTVLRGIRLRQHDLTAFFFQVRRDKPTWKLELNCNGVSFHCSASNNKACDSLFPLLGFEQ